jgi:glutamate-5-semialdehyde dehydrogenase
MLDRLLLDEKRLSNLADAVRNIASLEDPVGRMVSMSKRPNGLEVCRVRVPIGVIAIIYEARPNVTIDSFALSFKAGNAVVLRGGSESFRSNTALVELVREALAAEGLPRDSAVYLASTDREAVNELVRLDDCLDLVIPRGGEGLIRAVMEHSRVPVIKHYKGVCHIYIDASADLSEAVKITVNAKVQRPGVCNAAEKVLIHRDFPEPGKVIQALLDNRVEVRCDDRLINLNSACKKAVESDWTEEYLGLIIAAAEVDSLEDAVRHINRYGSHHSDSIVTKDLASARKFMAEVDSAAVYVNASTRFTDGAEFGLGAEIGISTDKIHCRGPMGLEDLTSTKYMVWGDGHIRT